MEYIWRWRMHGIDGIDGVDGILGVDGIMGNTRTFKILKASDFIKILRYIFVIFH
jgi:hypothetical protein